MNWKLAITLAAALTTAAAFDEKLVPLFDGKTLNGWEQCNGTAKYRVENGAIVGTTVKGSPNSFLCTKKPYADFILEFEVKVDPGLNSGVQLRSHRYAAATTVLTENNGIRKRTHEAGRVHGYQVEIADQKTKHSGGIYDEARRGWVANIENDPAAGAAFRDNEWNKYRVVAIGDSIKTWVNGVACANLVDPVDQEGFLALQVHQFAGEKPEEVRWRNIRIQDLGKRVWKPIFDGRSMAGWKKFGGGEWTIVDGALHGTVQKGGERGLLLSEKPYSDFTVRLKYKVVKGNSGFFFRMGDPNSKEPGSRGYEVEVDATRDIGGLQEPGKRGWIKHTDAKVHEMINKTDDWNEMVVSAHGRRVVVHVNGLKTADSADDPGRTEGLMALQINAGQDLEVMYKDIALLMPSKR